MLWSVKVKNHEMVDPKRQPLDKLKSEGHPPVLVGKHDGSERNVGLGPRPRREKGVRVDERAPNGPVVLACETQASPIMSLGCLQIPHFVCITV